MASSSDSTERIAADILIAAIASTKNPAERKAENVAEAYQVIFNAVLKARLNSSEND